MEKLLGMLQKGLVFVMSAPAGTGKTTLTRLLIDEFPCISESVSCTTRKKRGAEIEGKDYHFLSQEEFDAKGAAGEFLEHANVFGHSYGTLRAHVEQMQSVGKHVVLVIDTQGAMKLKKEGFEAVYIFIRPPSMAELRTRLFNRKTEDESKIEERLKWAEHEMGMAEKYDYIVTNDNLHRALEILRSIFIAEEHKSERYHDRNTYE